MGCQDQDQETSSYSFTKREIRGISDNHFFFKVKKIAFCVDKANRIFKENHKNIKELYKIGRFNILKTPAIHRNSILDR
jgi:hypothetical protein